MIEDMPNIDLSGIDSLRAIREEQGTLHDRIEKMEEKRGKVSDAVFEKVHSDYDKRLNELNEEAAPQRNQVRAEYAKLKALMESLTEALDKVRFEKEELEFRHELGEYVGDDYEGAKADCEKRLTERQADLDEADQLKVKFLEVFDSEEDLNAGLEAAAEPEPEPAPEPEPEPEAAVEEVDEPVDESESEDESGAADDDAQSEDEPEDDASEEDMTPQAELIEESEYEEMPTPPPFDAEADDQEPEREFTEEVMAELDAEQGEAAVVEEADADELDEADLVEDEDDKAPGPEEETMAGIPSDLLAPPDVGSDTIEPTPPLPPPVPSLGEPATMKLDKSQFDWSSPPEDEPDGTMIITNPKIISVVDGVEAQVYALGMGTTSVGRSPDNDIHIPEERVSRKHAQIAFGPGGYAIYDLNSENGTYVNGNRVREHFLMDGDVLLIGTNQFLYRER